MRYKNQNHVDFTLNYVLPTFAYFIVWIIIILVCLALKADVWHFFLATILNGTIYYCWLKKLNKF